MTNDTLGMVGIYLLTPSSRVLLEKLRGLQLVKKFPLYYGTRKLITAFSSAHHLSLSRASSIQSIPPKTPSENPSQYYPPIYACVSQMVSFLHVPQQNRVYATPIPIRATCPAHFILLDFITRTIFGEQ